MTKVEAAYKLANMLKQYGDSLVKQIMEEEPDLVLDFDVHILCCGRDEFERMKAQEALNAIQRPDLN